MAKRKESADQLRERILGAMQRDIGISEQMAMPFVDSIMRCFAGERPYFPTSSRSYPVLQIKAALERGTPVKRVLSQFEISRAKLHELFPGGLPIPQKPSLSTTLAKMETN